MTHRMPAVLIVLALIGGKARAQVAPADVDRIFERWNQKGSPGCVLGVIQNGAFVYQRGYGSANLDYAIPNSPDMVYYVGSVSKQFTAAAIALLAQDGRIGLDDPVSQYIPEVAHLPRMSVRQLVHHMAGVRDIYVLMALAGIRMQDVLPEEEAIALIARQRELNFAPGTDYLYSNSGYLLLAQIIKRVTGQSLRGFADERIFRPLGMTHTHFHDEPYHVLVNRAISYEPGEGGYRIAYLANFDKIGAGGLYTTLGDLLKWDQNFYDNRLGAGFLELMHTRGVLNRGDTLPYAFGLQIGQYRGLKTVRHSGSLMGFKADLVRFPDQRLSIATLCNLESVNPTALNNQVADLYLAPQLGPRVASSPPARAPASGAKAAPPAFEPGEYTGSYHSDELDTTYRVEIASDGLRLHGGLPPARALAPVERDVFRSGSYTLNFQRAASGRVIGFTIEAGRVRNIKFQRQ
ncbi:MAG TPA: serine hydrolase domain-containing protein [Longimicrobiales bacterium]|nr:serine hydrolase domain-containing protein [Longimicrobiales bacterium]